MATDSSILAWIIPWAEDPAEVCVHCGTLGVPRHEQTVTAQQEPFLPTPLVPARWGQS